MAGCPLIKIRIMGNKIAKIKQVQQRAAEQGINFSGDYQGGEFSGKGIAGTYALLAKVVTLDVTETGTEPCDAIERQIREFFR